MKSRMISLALCLLVFITGCSKGNNIAACEYKTSQTYILGTEWRISNKELTNTVNQNYVTVTNQTVTILDYIVSLTDFFYDKNTDLIVFKILFTNKEGGALSDKQQKNIQTMLDSGKLEFQFDAISYSNCTSELKTAQDGNTILLNSVLLSSITSSDTIKKIKSKPVTLLNVLYKNDIVRTFSIPDYTFKSKVLSTDIPTDSNLLSLNVSEYGVDIIWNTKSIIKKFKKQLKELSKEKGFNEENYGYFVYSNISLTLRDGTKYELTKGNNTIVLYDDIESYDENYLYNYHVLFKSKLNVSEVDYVSIDGENYTI